MSSVKVLKVKLFLFCCNRRGRVSDW